MNSQSTAQIFLDDVRVPACNMIGDEGAALRNTLTLFERSRVFVACQGLGIARRALDESIRYATERRQHGKVIAGHQLISAMLAEMATNVDAARLLALRAAAMIDAGVPAEMEAAMAKYFACEAAVNDLPTGRPDPRRQRRDDGVPGREARHVKRSSCPFRRVRRRSSN